MRPSIPEIFWLLYNLLVCFLALVWRRLLWNTRVIAITGSVGKTMTKDCLAAILSQRFPIEFTIGSCNGRRGLPRTVLRTRHRHRFLIAEVGIQRPGRMWRSALLLRPDMVVMLGIARTHPEGLPSLDVVASEKAKLLDWTSRHSVAVLNGDDPRVKAMARCRAFRVSFFGSSPDFDVWADEVSAIWPDRLSFRVHAMGQVERVQTRLVGDHWLPSVLAAIGAALQCGMSLAEAARCLQEVPPTVARMQPVQLPGGATMIRDEMNGAPVTAEAALKVLEEARVARKVVVFGCLYDGPGTSLKDVIQIAMKIGSVADVAVVVGSSSEAACHAVVQAGMRARNVHQASSLPQAAEVLRKITRRGDLVLLRGTWDWHLSRIYFAQFGDVGCWRTDCTRKGTCDSCERLDFRPRTGKRGESPEEGTCDVAIPLREAPGNLESLRPGQNTPSV